jgi:hypothetical protein
MKRSTLFIYSFILISFVLVSKLLLADERNLLPRFPEIVIENDIAVTSLKAVLTNISEKEISSSVKFRILYPTSYEKIDIKVNGKAFKYDVEQPRYSFSLKPNEEITFDMNANVYIYYSIDAVRKSIKNMEEEQKPGVRNAKKSAKAKGQDIANSFLRFFKSNDRYGKRFQVGPLVSKWGLFPVDFEKVNIEIKVPEKYTLITSFDYVWQDVTKAKKSIVYKATDIDNYSDAIFLPESEKEEQLSTMKVLKSGILRK